MREKPKNILNILKINHSTTNNGGLWTKCAKPSPLHSSLKTCTANGLDPGSAGQITRTSFGGFPEYTNILFNVGHLVGSSGLGFNGRNAPQLNKNRLLNYWFEIYRA